MKNMLLTTVVTASVLATALLTSCDWSSGSQSNFNTSGGSSITNISGFYEGILGGLAVQGNSRGNITGLSIQQSGNRVQVTDNQGSTYSGSVGSPASVAIPNNTTIVDGALLAAYQINFQGRDGVAARDIQFTGTINLVAVNDIVGDASTVTNTRDNSIISETSDETTSTIVTTNEVGTVTTRTITTNDDTTNNSGSNVTSTDTVNFQLTDTNTQLRMRGTWSEVGGPTARVDAVAAGVFTNFIPEIPDGDGDGGGGGAGGG